jgi:CheY-like chemotaxis protein
MAIPFIVPNQTAIKSQPMERRRPHQPPATLVLLVDGHEDTRELYEVALESFEFEIMIVDGSASAFERAWAAHPDVIVTEISFPSFDGLARKIRAMLDRDPVRFQSS